MLIFVKLQSSLAGFNNSQRHTHTYTHIHTHQTWSRWGDSCCIHVDPAELLHGWHDNGWLEKVAAAAPQLSSLESAEGWWVQVNAWIRWRSRVKADQVGLFTEGKKEMDWQISRREWADDMMNKWGSDQISSWWFLGAPGAQIKSIKLFIFTSFSTFETSHFYLRCNSAETQSGAPQCQFLSPFIYFQNSQIFSHDWWSVTCGDHGNVNKKKPVLFKWREIRVNYKTVINDSRLQQPRLVSWILFACEGKVQSTLNTHHWVH